ncbi:MAG: asparaginase domain-containing protein [Campylobacterales bacterium]|nr:asparaginase domain-containing protein [Campylobacterales bacterium]
MLILNTGGTFNKRYNPLTGELFVPVDNDAVEEILQSLVIDMDVQGILYKDSLEMGDTDRSLLADTIVQSNEKVIIVVHGTDTMDVSAEVIARLALQKTVIFTGAMVPFSVDPIEATANLAMAIGFAQRSCSGVYIVMQGICGQYNYVRKNRECGKFEYV